jgi:hypothetical protein
MTEPKGERAEVITYMIRDNAGMIRDRGMASLERARERAAALMENEYGARSYTILRNVYVSFTDQEEVETMERGA